MSGSPFTGNGYFKFAVMDAASGNGTTNYWANDGTASGQPSTAVALAVTGGLFDVMLGDTSLAGMTQTITQSAFNQTTTYLRVWFSQTPGGPFQALDPNQRIGSAAYALRNPCGKCGCASTGGVAAWRSPDYEQSQRETCRCGPWRVFRLSGNHSAAATGHDMTYALSH